MFLGPRAEIQAAGLSDTGCESCWHQKMAFTSLVTCPKLHGYPPGHGSDLWDMRDITGYLPWVSLLPPTHSIPHLQMGYKWQLLVSHITSFWKKNSIGTTPSLHRSKGRWTLNQQLWRWPWESRNRIMPLLRVAQVLVITAASAILTPLNSCLICVRLGFEELK